MLDVRVARCVPNRSIANNEEWYDSYGLGCSFVAEFAESEGDDSSPEGQDKGSKKNDKLANGHGLLLAILTLLSEKEDVR